MHVEIGIEQGTFHKLSLAVRSLWKSATGLPSGGNTGRTSPIAIVTMAGLPSASPIIPVTPA